MKRKAIPALCAAAPAGPGPHRLRRRHRRRPGGVYRVSDAAKAVALEAAGGGGG